MAILSEFAIEWEYVIPGSGQIPHEHLHNTPKWNEALRKTFLEKVMSSLSPTGWVRIKNLQG